MNDAGRPPKRTEYWNTCMDFPGPGDECDHKRDALKCVGVGSW